MSGSQAQKLIDSPDSLLEDEQSPVSDNYSSFESMEDCTKAFEVARQWLETWRQTGNTRHLAIAITCQRIAKERFAPFKAELSFHGEYEAQIAKTMQQIERSLIASQRILDGGELSYDSEAGCHITKLVTRW